MKSVELLQKFLFSSLLMAALTHAPSAQAQLTAQEKTDAVDSMMQKKRDFQSYLKDRIKNSELELQAAIAIRESRERELREQLERQARHRAQMKRYSMEEIEAQDRLDEQRILNRDLAAEARRNAYVERRDSLREIEASIRPVDPLLEFDIDLKKEPDFKSSHPSKDMEQLWSGSD